MIIYIYGSDRFKKEINDVLNHANIKFRLDEHGEIKDLNTLDELKEAIEDNPSNIYLIDDSKIIKKNSLNQKIKFLQPKDGIEQEYLLDHGIGDLSVDSIEELTKHIIKRLESVIGDEESSMIQDSIVEIVEDAYEHDEEEEETKEFFQLDDELSALLSQVDTKKSNEEDAQKVELIDDIPTNSLNFEEDFANIGLIDEEEDDFFDNEVPSVEIDEIAQGEVMADEFAEFDTLNEEDILAALDGFEGEVQTTKSGGMKSTSVVSSVQQSNESVEVSSSNINEIAQLLSKLLNNKTLEITIKVKD